MAILHIHNASGDTQVDTAKDYDLATEFFDKALEQGRRHYVVSDTKKSGRKRGQLHGSDENQR